MVKVKGVAIAAILTLVSLSSAALAQLSGKPVTVVGQFLDEDDENEELSGIACSTPLGTDTRMCLVALDEGLAAQRATLTLSPEPTLTVGDVVKLFDNSSNTAALREGIPDDACSEPEKKYNEHDSEGVAFLTDSNGTSYYVITGSHGCGRKSNALKASSFVDVRVPVSDTGSSPEVTARLNPVLANLEELNDAFGKDIADGKGVTIEGVAESDNRLFFGLRSPVIDDKALIIAVNAAEIFSDTGDLDVKLHTVDLMGRGVRDLATLDTNPTRLLVLAGPIASEERGHAVFLFSPNGSSGSDESKLLSELPVTGKAKAEGLLIAARDDDDVTVLIVHDGVMNGAPTLYELPPLP